MVSAGLADRELGHQGHVGDLQTGPADVEHGGEEGVVEHPEGVPLDGGAQETLLEDEQETDHDRDEAEDVPGLPLADAGVGAVGPEAH